MHTWQQVNVAQPDFGLQGLTGKATEDAEEAFEKALINLMAAQARFARAVKSS
jgi:hypothetical protein